MYYLKTLNGWWARDQKSVLERCIVWEHCSSALDFQSNLDLVVPWSLSSFELLMFS